MSKRRKLDIGDVNSLLVEFISEKAVQNFKSGADESEFEKTISEISFENNISEEAVDKFKCGADDMEFETKLSERVRRCNNLKEVREKCSRQAIKFKYSLELFNRIPMWFFRSLTAEDPLCKNELNSTKLEMMLIFALINEIEASLMMAFYLEGGQSVDDCFRLHAFFINMKKLYDKTENYLRTSFLGNLFTFHCQSKTLRRVDMSLVQCATTEKEPFIMDSLEFRRERFIRKMIRTGKFTSLDNIEITQIKKCWQNGLRLKGLMKGSNKK